MDATAVLELLVLGALMGMLGQGARAVVGLKTMTDYANAQGVSASDLFVAGRLITSLLIGILVGLASALVYYISGGTATDLTWHVLVGWAGAAYAGTDALESFIAQYVSPGAPTPTVKLHPASIDSLTTHLAAAVSPSPLSIVQSAFLTGFNVQSVTPGDNLGKLLPTTPGDYLKLEGYINVQLRNIRGAAMLGQAALNHWQAQTATVQTVIDDVTKALP